MLNEDVVSSVNAVCATLVLCFARTNPNTDSLSNITLEARRKHPTGLNQCWAERISCECFIFSIVTT
jgi:hypothetical protein